MQRAGRPIHINDTLTHAVDATNSTKYFIPRKSSPQSRTQNLFGPNWNTGGGAISPNVTTTAPTVSGTTDVTWNDGGGNISNYINEGTSKNQVTTGFAQQGARSKSFTIRNTGTATQDDLKVSFDNGANFFTLGPGESYSAEISIYYFLVQRAAADNGAALNPTEQHGVFEAVAVLA